MAASKKFKMCITKDTWIKCNGEFSAKRSNSFVMSKPVHVKRLNFERARSSGDDFVTTDADLASIKPIETNRLVTAWIEKGTVAAALQDDDDIASCFNEFTNNDRHAAGEEIVESTSASTPLVCDKSPILNSRGKSKTREERQFDDWEEGNISTQDSPTSPIFGRKRKRRAEMTEAYDPDLIQSLTHGFRQNRTFEVESTHHALRMDGHSLPIFKSFSEYLSDTVHSQNRSNNSVDVPKNLDVSPVFKSRLKSTRHSTSVSIAVQTSSTSIDKNRRSIANTSPVLRRLSQSSEGRRQKLKQTKLEELYEPERNSSLAEYFEANMTRHLSTHANIDGCSSDAMDRQIVARNSVGIGDIGEKHTDTKSNVEFFQNNGESRDALPRREIATYKNESEGKKIFPGAVFAVRNSSTREAVFTVESEVIDCDTESEKELGSPRQLEIGESESNSDATVSDFIEELDSQTNSSPVKTQVEIHLRAPRSVDASSLVNSVVAVSENISDAASLKEPTSDTVSAIQVSETSPPSTPRNESSVAILLNSGKKKKKLKKGSLSERLQRLVSGQTSDVRLWRHQVSQGSTIERTFASLCVIDRSEVYEKSLFRSRLVEDPHNLLNDCFEEPGTSNVGKTVILMTNHRYVGKPNWLPGTIVNIYPPLEAFNLRCEKGEPTLHVLKFLVVSNPAKMEPVAIEDESLQRSEKKAVQNYDCPCLKEGKIMEGCSSNTCEPKENVMRTILKL